MELLHRLTSRLRRGQSLLEIITVLGLTAIFLPALLTGLVASREGRAQGAQRAEAVSLLTETGESLRVIRESGWSAFATNGTYYPVIQSGSWTLTSGIETVGDFSRSVEISDVFRDSSGSIVSSGGTVDPSTKRAVVTVGWTTPETSSVTLDLYFTRYLDNLTFTHSTQAEFDAGTFTSTASSNSSGGEVVLGAGGYGNWCEPELSIAAVDLPKNGVANALTAIEGLAFAGTGENASGVSFASVSVSNTNPPVSSISGTFDGYKTNEVFGESGYAYLATDNNSKEIVIIDLNQLDIPTGKYAEVGTFNASGNTDADSIYVSGNVGYMTAGSTLRTFDLSSKTGARSQLGSLSLAGTGTRIFVVGTYAYVSISGSSTEMQVVNVSNPASLSVVGQADVNGQAAKDVFVNSTGTRAYLATGTSSTQPEFFIIDVSTKTGNRPTLGSYSTSGMNPTGITVVSGNKAIIVGSSGEEYQVIDISNESSPSRCGGMEVSSGINGVASVLEQDGDAYSYILTGDSSSEFNAIEGGPGGQYAATGTFESSTFDAGYSTAFNRFSTTSTIPNSTTLQYQVAVSDAVSGSCSGAGFTFVGPDGTSGTFFSSSGGTIPTSTGSGYANPGRCFRYRAYLSTTDSTSTPIFSDITVNYSP